MSRIFIQSWRLGLVAVIVFASFAGISARLVYLQVFAAEELSRIAETNRRRLEVRPARRGNIHDRRGYVLAATRPVVDLGVDPQVFDPNSLPKLKPLAHLIDRPVTELESAVSRKTHPVRGREGVPRLVRWVELVEGLDESVYEEVMALGIKGIYGNRRYERFYPMETTASHVIGFLNKENVAVMGVEKWLDFFLRGQDGWVETERDGRRRELIQFRDRVVEARDGLSVELTLDVVIQDMVERELERLVEEYEPAGAVMVVTDARDGSILALGNAPTFDPNRFWEAPLEAQRNRAVTDVFEPGSTFKIIPAAAVLEEGLGTVDDLFDCAQPVADYGGRRVSLPRDDHPMGELTLREVVIKSSNRGAALLGMRLGEEGLYGWARQFGFGEKVGWGPGGEVRGILHEVEAWDGLTVSRLPMGHAIAATALQVHFAMGVLASGGFYLEPRLVQRVVDADGATVLDYYPDVRRRVISEETAEVMAEMLARVTEPGGTAKRGGIPGFEVAGKTGTTQKIVDGGYSRSEHIASFSGFFPAREPRVVVTVVVDTAKMPESSSGWRPTAYGGVVAAPAFRSVGEQIIRYLALQPARATLAAAEGGRE